MPEIFIDLAKELKLENYHPIELESNTTEEEAKELKKLTGNNSNNVLPMKLSKKFIDAHEPLLDRYLKDISICFLMLFGVAP